MNRLQGKVAVITGGASGIGLATAKAFLKEGARVVVAGRDQKNVDKAKDLLGASGVAIRADVTKMEELDSLYARVREEFEHIDVLFANAGIPGASLSVEKMTSNEFDAVFATNVRGTFFTVQKALPLLREGASVILTTSIANQMARANVSAYAASKAAVRSLTQSFAAELIGRGVTAMGLKFSVLSDEKSAIAKAFGLAYQFPDDLKDVYLHVFKTDLSRIDADTEWTLPIPARIVRLARNGRP